MQGAGHSLQAHFVCCWAPSGMQPLRKALPSTHNPRSMASSESSFQECKWQLPKLQSAARELPARHAAVSQALWVLLLWRRREWGLASGAKDDLLSRRASSWRVANKRLCQRKLQEGHRGTVACRVDLSPSLTGMKVRSALGNLRKAEV